MSEAQEKARALLAAAGDEWDDNGVAGTPNSFWAVANAREDYGTAHADAALIAAAPGLLAALCDENDALRAELAQEAPPGALCVCVGATYSFDPGRNVIGQRVGYSITAGVGCPACGGRGVVAGGDAG